jgi:hypothetical protein
MTHIVAAQSVLLGNALNPNQNYGPDLTDLSKVFWSNTASGVTDYTGHETWVEATPPSWWSAEAAPDPIQAVAATSSEVWVMGTKTVQLLVPDYERFWAPAAVLEHGLRERYSLIRMDGAFAWLDDRKRIVLSDGRQVSPISEDIQNDLQQLDVRGCYGYRVNVGYADCMVWTFPAAGLTLSYQVGGAWAQWAHGAGVWRPFPVSAHAYNGTVNLVGMTDGSVGEMSLLGGSDVVGGTSEPIRASITTGYQDRGTQGWKHCRMVSLRVKRGNVTDRNDAVGRLSWRDDRGSWRPPIEFCVGATGDDEAVIEFRSLGSYRVRQWKFDFGSSADLVLASAVETFDVGEEW